MRDARPEPALQEMSHAVSKIALAHAGNWRVAGHHERGVPRRFRTRDRRFRHRPATWDVELIPERPPRAFADFFESSAGKRGQDVASAGRARFSRGVHLT